MAHTFSLTPIYGADIFSNRPWRQYVPANFANLPKVADAIKGRCKKVDGSTTPTIHIAKVA